jgi:hypothetical protein
MSLAIVGQPYIDYGPDPVFVPKPATFSVTIFLPQNVATRAIELALIERALEICARNARSAGGKLTSATIADGQVKLGNYTYVSTTRF